MNERLLEQGQIAKDAARILRKTSAQSRNQALKLMASAIEKHEDLIIEANKVDLLEGQANGLTESMLERLTLTPERIKGMANGLRQMAELPDPISKTDTEWINRDGLRISQRRVPIGVIGMIYESRPNVTVDAAGLTLKSGNAVILRGGKEAIHSNQTIVEILQNALSMSPIPKHSVQLIENTSREIVTEFMQMTDYVDCLIPRGGAGLIQSVKENAKVPVIETGVGNCHLYIHEAADIDKAEAILINGKTQRTSVCNALETLIIDRSISEDVLPRLAHALYREGVEIRGEADAQALVTGIQEVSESDYQNEFLDLVIAVKIVDGYEAAIKHIDTYSTGHSDAIVTENYTVAQNFLRDIDSACVYVNASTRFSDGEVFGFGGEIGISTQKLHARGPMGLDALTSYKYTILGNGQIRG